MNFLIMTRLPQIYSSQRLVQEIRARGHHVLCENPESPWPAANVASTESVVIPRLGNFRYPEALAQFQHMEQLYPRARVLNPSAFFHQARHKKRAHEVLSDLPQPKLYQHPESFPIVVKDCISSQGEGVFLCQNQQQWEECMHKLQGREVLFQEFIPECAGQDVRAFVIGKQIMASIERRAQSDSGEFRANLSLGGTASPATLTREEIELCVLAVQRLQLDYAGVDFIRSKRGPLLLEINPCPGLEGVEKCTGVNVAQGMVLYAESLFTPSSKR